MAERTSTRTGSRRTTPQPAAQTARAGTQSPSKRTTRTTRSQSRDISDREDGRIGPNARRGAKQATQDGTNGTVAQSSSKSRKGRPANHAPVNQDLSVVAEDPGAVYPNLGTTEGGGAGENVEDAGADQLQTQQNDKSPGGLSAFSGTTARISLPTQELTELSPEDMLDALPDLSDTSDKLISFVISAELSQGSVATTISQLQNKNTREHKKLKRLGDTFERQRKEFGGDSYINVGDTLRRLLGRKAGPIDEQTASWRPDALIQKANLTILVLQMLSITKQEQKDHFVEDIADTFPQLFVQRLGLAESLTPECSALAEATFRLALEVRTQEAIMLLARHVGKLNFDPDNALLQVFYDTNNLKGWAISGLRIADLTKEAKDTILGRVEKLREAFRSNGPMSSDGQTSAVESLRVNCSWATFAQQMVAWAAQRLTEIEIQTTTYGGAQAICQELSDVIQSGMLGQSLGGDYESDSPELRLDFDAQSESRATSEQQDASAKPARADELKLAQFSADSNKVRSAVALLKQREADRKVTKAPKQKPLPQNHDSHSFVQVASTAGPSIRALTPQRLHNDQVIPSTTPTSLPNRQAPSADQNDNWTPDDNEEEEGDINIRRRAEVSLAYRRQREAESNKENLAEIPELQQTRTATKRSIYDRDPLAERVPPIDSQDSDNNGPETEISSDEGFQLQAGSSNAARQRYLKPATKGPAPEIEISSDEGSQLQAGSSNAARQHYLKPATKRPAPEPTSLKRRSPKKVRVQQKVNVRTFNDRRDVARDEQEVELPLSQAYDEYERVKASAKQRMAVVTKPPQSRSAWTGVETDMLHYLITEYGTSWKLLKNEDREQGHILEARDQVALKDKARNMKMDYLKAGRVLPQNFERIPLSQLQIKRLRDGGIEYDPETGTRVDAEVID